MRERWRGGLAGLLRHVKGLGFDFVRDCTSRCGEMCAGHEPAHIAFFGYDDLRSEKSAGSTMASIGEQDYRAGARERLAEGYILLRRERFGGSIYIAGRAVEGMLRAVIWKSDPEYSTGRKNLETGHNLRDMLGLIGRLGTLRQNPMRDEIGEAVQHVSRLWWNDM